MTQPTLPLAGVKVLDLSRVLAGPLCAQTLGDLGADVTKIEAPGGGDETRGWGPPFVEGVTSYYRCCNKQKTLKTLDLKNTEGRNALYAMVREYDVLIHNYLPSTAERLGLDPVALSKLNPRLILARISGFGSTGPGAERPGYDFAIQALSGLMAVTGEPDGVPMKVGVAMVDVVTALYAANGIQAALLRRHADGKGATVDVSLIDGALAAQVNLIQSYLDSNEQPTRRGNAHAQIAPYDLFATSDSHVVLTIGNDRQWQSLCRALERSDLAGDRRFTTNTDRVTHREVITTELGKILVTRPTSQWCDLFEKAELPHAPVQNYREALAMPSVNASGLVAKSGEHREILSPIVLDGKRLTLRRAAPSRDLE